MGTVLVPAWDCITMSERIFPEKEIDVYLEELPNTLKFMKNTDKIRHEVTEEKTYDLFIALDCGDMGRLGFSAVLFQKSGQ